MFRHLALASLLTALFLVRGAQAQCPMPDGLDGGPCCAIASPNLPQFPAFAQDTLEICWRNCAVDSLINYRSTWTNLNVATSSGIPCGERLMSVVIRNGAGIVQWKGTFRLQYSRTWLVTDPSGFPIQVWRFLMNGDMTPAVGVAVPCPVPICAAPNGNRVRFTGYMDYAANCALVPTFYQESWMLTHACDQIDHQPGFPRAGAFHPDRAYTFVGPLAGFVPGPLQPVEGTPGSVFEALRRRNLTSTAGTVPTCEFEEKVNFNLLPMQQLCLCGPTTGPQQLFIGNLTVNGTCGTSVTSPGGPIFPGFMSMGIGAWTIAGTYPGQQNLRWNVGGYDYVDPCIGVVTREIFFGVTTIGGYPARQLLAGGPGGPLPPFFIDQSNSLRPAGGGVVLNVQYVSDHFLNLNH